jgi:hypothetical protein
MPETPGDFEFHFTAHAIRAANHAWLRVSLSLRDASLADVA